MPPLTLCVNEWRLPSNEERMQYLNNLKSRDKKGGPRKRRGSVLIFRSKIRPVDMYAYLRAKFGLPNGMQTLLRSDDSDNIFHWDYNLRCGDADIYIVGATRQIHFHSSETLKPVDWPVLLRNIKEDFGNYGRKKSEIINRFEKWVVFQNKFAILADVCADLHARITDVPSFKSFTHGTIGIKRSRNINRDARLASKRATDLHGDCLKLRLLTPIMAEAFINLFILAFCKTEVRNNVELYQSFIREKIPLRLRMLYTHCDYLIKPVDEASVSYAAFLRMINKRNNLIHGNMDPIKDQIEVVYFEGKRPLLYDTGDHIGHFFEKLEELYDPHGVVEDYINTHLFLMDIANCLPLQIHQWFRNVWSDSYPGYEIRQQRITRLFPSYISTASFPAMRFDDELAVEW